MRLIILSLILLSQIANVLAQDDSSKKELLLAQKKAFIKAEKLLKKSDEINALQKFHFVYNRNLNTEYEKIAKKRIDSLSPDNSKKTNKKSKRKMEAKASDILFTLL